MATSTAVRVVPRAEPALRAVLTQVEASVRASVGTRESAAVKVTTRSGAVSVPVTTRTAPTPRRCGTRAAAPVWAARSTARRTVSVVVQAGSRRTRAQHRPARIAPTPVTDSSNPRTPGRWARSASDATPTKHDAPAAPVSTRATSSRRNRPTVSGSGRRTPSPVGDLRVAGGT
ncbi:hypothetical protein GCM10027596_37090 [Nocardioides korecus]